MLTPLEKDLLYVLKNLLSHMPKGADKITKKNQAVGCAWNLARAAVNKAEATAAEPSPDDDLLEAMAEVLRISDRDHIAWHNARAKLAIAKARRLS